MLAVDGPMLAYMILPKPVLHSSYWRTAEHVAGGMIKVWGMIEGSDNQGKAEGTWNVSRVSTIEIEGSDTHLQRGVFIHRRDLAGGR